MKGSIFDISNFKETPLHDCYGEKIKITMFNVKEIFDLEESAREGFRKRQETLINQKQEEKNYENKQ